MLKRVEKLEPTSDDEYFDYSKLSEKAIRDLLACTDENDKVDLSRITDETLDELINASSPHEPRSARHEPP